MQHSLLLTFFLIQNLGFVNYQEKETHGEKICRDRDKLYVNDMDGTAKGKNRKADLA